MGHAEVVEADTGQGRWVAAGGKGGSWTRPSKRQGGLLTFLFFPLFPPPVLKGEVLPPC